MDEWQSVGSLEELYRMGGRKCVEVHGRSVVVFVLPDAAASRRQVDRSGAIHSGMRNKSIGQPYTNQEEKLFVIDSRCYHTGGPLEEGDIEDIGGTAYVICPWHKYVISLEDGNSIYVDMHKNQKSKGIRQRTHRIKKENGELFVQLTKMPGGEDEVQSDHYCPATEEEKRRMGLIKR